MTKEQTNNEEVLNDQEDGILTVVDENGNEIDFNILATFYSEDYDKNYVFYYNPIDGDEDEEAEVYISSYDENTQDLSPIEDEDELNMLEEVFESLLDEDGLLEDE